MKKLTKVVLAASMLAALFAGCSNGSLIANDELASPDVNYTVTENGVVVLTWENVKDAIGYDVLVKYDNTDEFADITWAYAGLSTGNRNVFSFNVEANKEYEFKVIAHADNTRVNLLDSYTTVDVETPETFSDTAIFAASEITLTKVPNTVNRYVIKFPVDLGFDYNWKLVKYSLDSANDLYNSTDFGTAPAQAGTYDGSSWILETDPEDDEKTVPAWIASVTIPTDKNEYVVVVKATPKNGDEATKKYQVSSTKIALEPALGGITYNDDLNAATADTSTSTSTAGTVVSSTTTNKVDLTFSADLIEGVAPDASKFRVYRETVTTVNTNNSTALCSYTTTSAITQLTGLAAYDEANKGSYDANYILKDTVVKNVTVVSTSATSSSTTTTSYTYNYYVVYDDANGDAVWSTVETY